MSDDLLARIARNERAQRALAEHFRTMAQLVNQDPSILDDEGKLKATEKRVTDLIPDYPEVRKEKGQ